MSSIEIANTLQEAAQIRKNQAVSKRILEVLHKKYPGHLWGVKVLDGMAFIKNMQTSGEEGYAIKFDLADFSASNFEKVITKGGGEVLERFGLSRSLVKPKEIMDLKYDRLGRVLQA